MTGALRLRGAVKRRRYGLIAAICAAALRWSRFWCAPFSHRLLAPPASPFSRSVAFSCPC